MVEPLTQLWATRSDRTRTMPQSRAQPDCDFRMYLEVGRTCPSLWAESLASANSFSYTTDALGSRGRGTLASHRGLKPLADLCL